MRPKLVKVQSKYPITKRLVAWVSPALPCATASVATKAKRKWAMVYTWRRPEYSGSYFARTGFSGTKLMSPNLGVPGNQPGPLTKADTNPVQSGMEQAFFHTLW